MTRRALVCGAGVAGPALAHWLHRYGWDVTVVERADDLRAGGANVDVHGAGRDVADRMGLVPGIRAAHTGEEGTDFVDGAGHPFARFPAEPGGPDLTSELEILRGDLVSLIVDAAPHAEYVFGDEVTSIEETGEGVRATLASGRTETADVLVAADGVGSATRRLVLGEEPVLRPIGLEMAWGTIPRTPDDTQWWRWHVAPGATFTTRPDPYGTTRATVSRSVERNADLLVELPEAQEVPELLREARDAGWQSRRICDALMQADDLYLEHLAQVQAPRWSDGRAVLLGDAAYCATPITGMGTSLALVGAYVLAGELAAHTAVTDALTAYERRMRPVVERAQRLPPGGPRPANPRSRAGVVALGAALRVASSRPARALAGRVGGSGDDVDLPSYAHLEQG